MYVHMPKTKARLDALLGTIFTPCLAQCLQIFRETSPHLKSGQYFTLSFRESLVGESWKRLPSQGASLRRLLSAQ